MSLSLKVLCVVLSLFVMFPSVAGATPSTDDEPIKDLAVGGTGGDSIGSLPNK